MTFVVDAADLNGTGNGDVCIRTDKGTLVALVYASDGASDRANVIAEALNAAFAPGHTDLMVSPEELDDWLEKNPPPADAEHYAKLVEEMAELPVWRKIRVARVAFGAAVKTIRRGRHLTDAEKLTNLFRALSDDATPS